MEIIDSAPKSWSAASASTSAPASAGVRVFGRRSMPYAWSRGVFLDNIGALNMVMPTIPESMWRYLSMNTNVERC